jgi:alkylated DNA repair dioxygenase AlkB
MLTLISPPPRALPKGLRYLPEFITPAEEACLLDFIDSNHWLGDLKRRVQHYGFRYNYKSRSVFPSDYLGPLPVELDVIAERLLALGLVDALPDQAIINEYEPGQGISAHIDCQPCFGNYIGSLSLLSTVDMHLKNPVTGELIVQKLAPRSLIMISDEARYDWTHAIPARKSDPTPMGNQVRSRRISVTFRKCIVGQ